MKHAELMDYLYNNGIKINILDDIGGVVCTECGQLEETYGSELKYVYCTDFFDYCGYISPYVDRFGKSK